MNRLAGMIERNRNNALADRGFWYHLADNIIGFDDGYETRGERLGKGINQLATGVFSDPVGMAASTGKAAVDDLNYLMFEGGAMEKPENVLAWAGGTGALGSAPAGALRAGPIRAYHGSPHDFDRFSMDKIGTGEGAQAYGHGLYFAENEGVARNYRDALSARAVPNDARGNAFDLVQRMGGDVEWTADTLRDGIKNTASPNTEQFLRETLKHIEDGTYADFERPLGRMYEVNIHADPDDFLDWDAPLSEQPQNARRGIENSLYYLPNHERPAIDRALRGEETPYDRDWNITRGANLIKKAPHGIEQELHKAGVPGIKYLDQGSRGAADGTRNFVVFDDKLIEIVKKYGIAAAAPMLGMTQADVDAFLREHGE